MLFRSIENFGKLKENLHTQTRVAYSRIIEKGSLQGVCVLPAIVRRNNKTLRAFKENGYAAYPFLDDYFAIEGLRVAYISKAFYLEHLRKKYKLSVIDSMGQVLASYNNGKKIYHDNLKLFPISQPLFDGMYYLMAAAKKKHISEKTYLSSNWSVFSI